MVNNNYLSLALPKIQFGLELEHDAGINYNIDNLASSLFSQGYGYNKKAYGHHSMIHHPLYFHTRGWLVETDESVSGGEVISPVMVDSDETWNVLNTVVKTIMESGGEINSIYSSCHIHIDTSILGKDSLAWQLLFSYVKHFQDILIFIGTNHERGFHRGNKNCSFDFLNESDEYQDTISLNKRYTNVISTRYVDAFTGTGHLEYRLNDASLNVDIMRVQVSCLLGMVWSAHKHKKVPKNDDLLAFLDTFLIDFPQAYSFVKDILLNINDFRELDTNYQLDYALQY